MKSKCFSILVAIGLSTGCGGGGDEDQPLGGQYTVKTSLVSTTCKNIKLGQGNTHIANITKSGDSVTISDNSGLSLSGSLGSNDSLTASGTLNVSVSGACSTSNTVNLTANLLDNSTLQGTARIQINYPGTCDRITGRTCAAELKYEAVRPASDGSPSANPSTIPAGTLLWSNPTRLGGGGTYPAVGVDRNGIAHGLYRRDKQVYYRRFANGTWGPEVRANDDGSRSELEIKDRNLPKVVVDDQNRGWLLWGGDLPSLFIYMRGVDASGNFTTPITELSITSVLPNMAAGGAGPGSIAERPEEVALSFSNIDKKLHISVVYVGDSDLAPYDQRRDGVYDMVVNPNTVTIESATKVGNASKNLYTVSGPSKSHGVFRLTVPLYYRYDGGSYVKVTVGEPPHKGVLGALNIWTPDDATIHSTTISTYPKLDKRDPRAYTHRDLHYAKFDPANARQLQDVVKIEEDFHSPIGIAPLLTAPGGHVFIAYDRAILELSPSPVTANNTTQEVGFAWRVGTAPAGSAFAGPSQAFFWPGRAISLGQEPATSISGSTIHVVWDGKQTNSFDAASAIFQ